MNTERIIGFTLLGIGVALILYSLYGSFGIFTGAQNPPEVVLVPMQETEGAMMQKKASVPSSPEDMQKQVEGVIGEQLQKILPMDVIPKTLNLSVWSIFVGIVILAGTQIAGIGVKLLAIKKN